MQLIESWSQWLRVYEKGLTRLPASGHLSMDMRERLNENLNADNARIHADESILGVHRE